ncbi:hypothetical protein MNBD_GAMMA08-645 [hydrothermal vent metagenome]|uniref:Uncharacterized protein n=1 Tax=hydrothermal vent metagenome TaxID=652676 RepID=A0A3B0XG52_9ZZZZ
MSIEDWKNLASAVQSVATILSFIIGGIWVYLKFIRQQEKYPNIEFSADIEFIGEQKDYWLAELIATIDNKGKAQHKMEKFRFDVNGLLSADNIEISDEWGGQVNFPHLIAKGSFLPEKYTHFFIDPGTKAKYSYITRIPKDASYIILHCWFKYMDERSYGHTAEKTAKVPVTINES